MSVASCFKLDTSNLNPCWPFCKPATQTLETGPAGNGTAGPFCLGLLLQARRLHAYSRRGEPEYRAGGQGRQKRMDATDRRRNDCPE